MGEFKIRVQRLFVNNGGLDTFLTDLVIMDRPLNTAEVRFLQQSGISMNKNYYTPNDPRLRGYWKCTDTVGDNPFVVQDRARMWDRLPAHLTRAHSQEIWSRIEDPLLSTSGPGPFGRIDLFGQDRTLGAVYDGFGNLGITSGTFVIMGGSSAQAGHNEADRRGALSCYPQRFRMATDLPTLDQPKLTEEYILSFEVTPSGEITDLDFPGVGGGPNSILYATSNGTNNVNDERFYCYLTTKNASGPDPLGFDAGTGASGVTVAFMTVINNAGSNSNPIISGTLPFGVPSRVMFHMKPLSPYLSTPVNGTRPVQIDLYIDGNKVNSVEKAPVDGYMWNNVALTSTSDHWLYEFGGYAVDDALGTPQAVLEDGLGEIYLREIFIAQGKFSKHDIQFFSQSGVARSSTLAGFNDQLPTSLVRVNDPRLVGYYRFTGGPGGSGHLDLSNLRETNTFESC